MRYRAALVLVVATLGAPLMAQVVIPLNSVIGPSGTNAAAVDGLGLAVNTTGVALNSGLTSLVAPDSPGPVAFDFNIGFADTLDRAIGSTAGAGNVYADLKYDSATTSPLILDLNGNGTFDDAAQTGFGMHADTFITFDLAVLRSVHGVPANATMTLSGTGGIANAGSVLPTSAAILLDGVPIGVYDWSAGAGTMTTNFTLSLASTGRYLTFAGLAGTDGDHFYAHVGFANVQLTAVPEPGTTLLLVAGLMLIPAARRIRFGP